MCSEAEAPVALLSKIKMSRKNRPKTEIHPRFRIRSGPTIALGPGKVELLQAVRQQGSISHAAKQMGMSYMRAWTLIRTMNACFKEPLVVAARGSVRGGGGARLTPAGLEVIHLYSKMNARCLAAIEPEWQRLQKLLSA